MISGLRKFPLIKMYLMQWDVYNVPCFKNICDLHIDCDREHLSKMIYLVSKYSITPQITAYGQEHSLKVIYLVPNTSNHLTNYVLWQARRIESDLRGFRT